ncbi:MAG TPA: hypothetical protein DHD79_01775 [Firmicutes bacterium]|jgi:hypothetical protein|nr:hypothetical protein [Bacillota bacterium]HAZ21233.1 hypothetical protein [Bacillota bacterium]HBE06150.1 hypothetical protein [Bacillota bacterium]HBG43061.1 hypothetical protein [Bacillota bacterium]HBL49123.1 hypothetical protein [Bacillota bacterium]
MYNKGLVKKGIIITLAVSLLITVFMLFDTVDQRTWSGILKFNPIFILVAGLMLIGSWIVEALRLKVLSNMLGEHLGHKDSMLISLATTFTSNVTPLTTGGPPTQVYFLHKKGLSVGKATVVVSMRVALTTIVRSFLAPVFYVIFRSYFPNFPAGEVLFFAISFISALTAVPLLMPNAFRKIFQWIMARKTVRRILGDRFDAAFARVMTTAEEFRANLSLIFKEKKGQLLIVFLLTILYWPLYLAIAPVMLLFGLGMKVVLTTVLVVQFVWLFLISCVPVPGGSGVTEIGFAALFKLFGVPQHLLGIFVVIWRVFTFYLNTFVGGAAFMRIVAKESRQEAIPG